MRFGNQMVDNIQKATNEKIKDPIEEIKRYKELLDAGIINEDEFEKRKSNYWNYKNKKEYSKI